MKLPIEPWQTKRRWTIILLIILFSLLSILLNNLKPFIDVQASMTPTLTCNASPEVNSCSYLPSVMSNLMPTASSTSTPTPTPTASPTLTPDSVMGIWTSAKELVGLPMTGPAWENLWDAGQQKTDNPDLSSNSDLTEVYVLAKALIYARTGDTKYRDEVIESIFAAMGTEGDGTGRVLPVARNLQAYVIAADLITLAANKREDQQFRDWLIHVRDLAFSDGPGYSIITCHERRPNNWGTHCGASRVAIARYLGDTDDLDQAATVFKGWLGDRSTYAGFKYGSDLSWQCDPDKPVGINPKGCIKDGHSIDGALPEEMRRGEPFQWPPAPTTYPWEGLQGALVQAEILNRAGYPTWEWEDQALLRAVQFLYDITWEAKGDDTWQIWLINDAYGTSVQAITPTSPGKNIGWADWTHAVP